MKIRGLQKTSLIDYPGKISTVIFSSGCNLRCGFCHNSDLVINPEEKRGISEKDIFTFLSSRKGLIDAIVLSGGEPLFQKDVIDFIKLVKKSDLLVKIDTNGFFPDKLKAAIDLGVDYVALDIKTSPSKYPVITGVNSDFNKVKESFEIIKSSSVDYELRMTCVDGFCSDKDFNEIEKALGMVKRFYIQQFVPEQTLDPAFQDIAPLPFSRLLEIKKIISGFCDDTILRGISEEIPAVREMASLSANI
ncbi:MAG: anaerobic ribonucleoside-triphosphate reductase activating protein [Spirochaetes bacterium]|nr:anaerobic ribonucleoside-triphosphate reductase activating protein [Spirochaetota bacterium]